jgi:DNA repair protein RecN (Recombination protein N)
MISHLRICDVALIREVEIDFGPGLNILTGETGAGKSILVDSINFLLGERPVRDFIRSGAESASVTGILEITDESVTNALTQLGFAPEDGQLMLSRAMTGNKSVCRVNGRTVAVGMLKEISALLVDVHGQHEHQSLLNTDKQLGLLDQFCDLTGLKQQLDAYIKSYREYGKALRALSGLGNQREARLEIIGFQRDEIKNAGLQKDEEETLNARRKRLGGLDKLVKLTSASLSLLDGGEGEQTALDQIGKALVFLQEIAEYDTERGGLADTLAEAATLVNDVAGELRDYAEELDADPQELERVEARLDAIYRLKKKYGATLADVISYGEKMDAEYERLVNAEQEINSLQAKRRGITREIAAVCAKMTAIRKRQAEVIERQITGVLTELGMKNARFKIDIQPKPAFGADGNDRVEFMISPNLGEPLKPLARIASGGEMSRMMLAVKTVLADADKIATLIFDEIDAGVSGRTAQQVAEKLNAVAKNKQLLCITHLPQIAAMADTHFLIEKTTRDDATVTSVRALDRDEIIGELARLTGGAVITEATRKAAGEMKEQAEGLKHSEYFARQLNKSQLT